MSYRFQIDDTDSVLVTHDSGAKDCLPSWTWLAGAVRQLVYERETLRVRAAELELADRAMRNASQLDADEIDRLRAEVAATSQQLGNLLALIHRDGGHYQAEHGTEKACADAETAVHVLRGGLDGYIEANRYMKAELDDALEDARKYCEAQREIARLREALEKLCEMADESDDAQYGTLGTNFVRDLSRAALAPVEVGNG